MFPEYQRQGFQFPHITLVGNISSVGAAGQVQQVGHQRNPFEVHTGGEYRHEGKIRFVAFQGFHDPGLVGYIEAEIDAGVGLQKIGQEPGQHIYAGGHAGDPKSARQSAPEGLSLRIQCFYIIQYGGGPFLELLSKLCEIYLSVDGFGDGHVEMLLQVPKPYRHGRLCEMQ